MSLFGPLTLRQIEVLHTVMQAGTVTAAAQALAISQPTVSVILRRMEDQLRFTLFHNVRGRLVPTNEARLLHASVERSLEHLKLIGNTVGALREGAQHRLSIATIQPLAKSVVPRALALLLASRPATRVHLLSRPRADVLRSVAVEGVDIAVSFSTGEAQGLDVQRIHTGRVHCVMPTGHPLARKREISPEDVARHQLVFYAPGNQWLLSEFDRLFAPLGPLPTPIVTVESIVSVYPLVREGIGIGLVDEYSLDHERDERIVARPFTPVVEVGVEVIRPSGRPATPLVAQFIDCLREACDAGRPPRLPARATVRR
jgi:DNA-binding transcriptional LysR family regulator